MQQSPEGSNSEQSDNELPLMNMEEDSDDCFEECTSQCEDPCTNERHTDRQTILNIIQSTLRENQNDIEASQEFYRTVLANESENKVPMFMRQ